MPVYLERSIADLPYVYVNGGRRGYLVGMSPADLVRVLRPVLVECLWRLNAFQPEYRLVKKWRPELLNPKTSRPRRKKIIVAMARAFAVDWWRVRTGRCKAQDLGLRLQPLKIPPSSAKTKPAPATDRRTQ